MDGAEIRCCCEGDFGGTGPFADSAQVLIRNTILSVHTTALRIAARAAVLVVLFAASITCTKRGSTLVKPTAPFVSQSRKEVHGWN
jgi:hypothetical protein